MGLYLNENNDGFRESLNSRIYVDKTGLIEPLNDVIRTRDKFVCVSRPRRFGKSMAADMLVAYYSRGCDSRELFSNLKIAEAESFEKHLNKYNVIHLNISDFSSIRNIDEKIKRILHAMVDEFPEEFPELGFDYSGELTVFSVMEMFKKAYAKIKIPFVFIIDEWDFLFRETKNDIESQNVYLDFLRSLLKDKTYVALAYMTGILPIKKYGVHSALNMFTEISMTETREYAKYTGFTEEEVKALCKEFDMSYEETKRWYDGYNVNGIAAYNPCSVVGAMKSHNFNSYWNQTETYEALKMYLVLDFDGLKDKITRLLAGEELEINTLKFQNDMTTFSCADDVLTLLIHLGYLTYDSDTKKVRIPNCEVSGEFVSSIKDGGWENVVKSLEQSKELLTFTLAGKADKVAEIIQQNHMENTSILKYNDENSLACVISLAYYSAREKYEVFHELPTGDGFADMVFLPRRNIALPALVVELKKDGSAKAAIEQIRSKRYSEKLKNYSGEVLLVGINYNSKEKNHSCVIEKQINL